jgi:hypothetical protein
MNYLYLFTIAQFAQIATGLGTLLVLYLTLDRTLRSARNLKKADVLMECHRRFDGLWEVRDFPSTLQDPKRYYERYYERYWSLHLDEYKHWQNGFIDDDIFRYWMRGRVHDWVANEPVGPVGSMSFKEGWRYAKSRWAHTNFFDFMEEVFKDNVESAMRDFKHRKFP